MKAVLFYAKTWSRNGRLPLSPGIKVRLLAAPAAIVVCLIAVLLALPVPVHAYAVLAHEAIIDVTWEMHIKPLLLKKFPQANRARI